MSTVVNWFLILIIFVFDPLAIALVIAANMAFAQIRKPEDPEEDYFSKRNEHIEKVVMSSPSADLKQRVKENQEKLKEEKKTEINTYGDDDWATPTEEEEKIVEEYVDDDTDFDVDGEPIKEEQKEEPNHEGKQMAKGFDTMIKVLEEEEKKTLDEAKKPKKERVIEVRDDGGHRIIFKSKEDIYKDKPKTKIHKPDLGRIPNPLKYKPKNL